ncbi:hypothetical protein CTAYLR_000551 [Chrysophaeum taylorii]|uniref:Methyltransferase domain-containing protein n=1 Tax=Chrysophaeum taylorii TaxID=2483200 RepID=A0AAD7UGW0_9STRA|nr:hypothetical protein CTAYLR_000551 [Chrysophaeum taylorii]
MGATYVANRGTFQAGYAEACFDRLAKGLAPRRILDVGCGTGDFVDALSRRLKCEVVGVDTSADMIAQAKRFPHRFEVKDLSEGPLDESFDLATSFMALHWPSRESRVRLLSNVTADVMVAGFHGAGSCEEGVRAVRKASGLDIEALPTMFHRDSKDVWLDDFRNAGWNDVDIQEREIRTVFSSENECARRLLAAWPPILAPYFQDQEPILLEAAAILMKDDAAAMTSRVLEVIATKK